MWIQKVIQKPRVFLGAVGSAADLRLGPGGAGDARLGRKHGARSGGLQGPLRHRKRQLHDQRGCPQGHYRYRDRPDGRADVLLCRHRLQRREQRERLFQPGELFSPGGKRGPCDAGDPDRCVRRPGERIHRLQHVGHRSQRRQPGIPLRLGRGCFPVGVLPASRTVGLRPALTP